MTIKNTAHKAHEYIAGKPSVVLANKSDRRGAAKPGAVAAALGVEPNGSSLAVLGCSAKQGKRLLPPLDWLRQAAERDGAELGPRMERDMKKVKEIRKADAARRKLARQKAIEERERKRAAMSAEDAIKDAVYEGDALPTEIVPAAPAAAEPAVMPAAGPAEPAPAKEASTEGSTSAWAAPAGQQSGGAGGAGATTLPPLDPPPAAGGKKKKRRKKANQVGPAPAIATAGDTDC